MNAAFGTLFALLCYSYWRCLESNRKREPMRIQIDSVSPEGTKYSTVMFVRDTGSTMAPVVFPNGWRLNVYTNDSKIERVYLPATDKLPDEKPAPIQDPILLNTRRIRS